MRAGEVPHCMHGAQRGLHADVRGDQVRLEVQEAHSVPPSQVRAGVREARLRVQEARGSCRQQHLLRMQPGQHPGIDDPGIGELRAHGRDAIVPGAHAPLQVPGAGDWSSGVLRLQAVRRPSRIGRDGLGAATDFAATAMPPQLLTPTPPRPGSAAVPRAGNFFQSLPSHSTQESVPCASL